MRLNLMAGLTLSGAWKVPRSQVHGESHTLRCMEIHTLSGAVRVTHSGLWRVTRSQVHGESHALGCMDSHTLSGAWRV